MLCYNALVCFSGFLWIRLYRQTLWAEWTRHGGEALPESGRKAEMTSNSPALSFGWRRVRRVALIVALMLAPIVVATVFGLSFFKASSASEIAGSASAPLGYGSDVWRDAGAAQVALVSTVMGWQDAGAANVTKAFSAIPAGSASGWRDAGVGTLLAGGGRVWSDAGAGR